jgi:DNA-binding winged helix-turn-helix (wHTH) protein
MSGATQGGRLLRFSVFEVSLNSGELFKQGRKVKLQEQPFELLLALMERPGAVISREDLKQKVWPSDTVVDFDHGLNRAINKVRDALGDSADSPRFIETVPRRGYRFIGSIQTESRAQPPPGPASPQTTPELPQPSPKPRSHRKVWFIAGVLGCVGLAVGVALTIASYVIARRTPPPIVSLPLTSGGPAVAANNAPRP